MTGSLPPQEASLCPRRGGGDSPMKCLGREKGCIALALAQEARQHTARKVANGEISPEQADIENNTTDKTWWIYCARFRGETR